MKSRQVAGVRHALGLTALLTMSGTASIALAQTEVFPMGDGRVSVSMDGCSVLFNDRGNIEQEGRDCRSADISEARDAFDRYRREQGARDDEAPRGGFGNFNSGSSGGVTVYQDTDYGGRSQTFFGDEPNLGRSSVGNDSISSIRVARGCEVTLYTDYDYRGNSVQIDRDEPALRGSRVGNDQVSSLRVDCGGSSSSSGSSRDGVSLYRDTDYGGTSETFDRDVPELGRTRIGNDQLSSIRVPRGCEVTLYSDNDYRGNSERLDRDEPELGRTRVGNDQVSSMRVDCR